MQWSVLFVFLGIVLALGVALFFLLKDQTGGARMAYALTVRVGLSIALFLLVLLAHFAGYLPGTGVAWY